jgi:hypothetical protein
MTTTQIVALGFPVVTLAVVGLTGLFIRRPWSEKVTPKAEPEVLHRVGLTVPTEVYAASLARDMADALTEADRILQKVRGQLVQPGSIATPRDQTIR